MVPHFFSLIEWLIIFHGNPVKAEFNGYFQPGLTDSEVKIGSIKPKKGEAKAHVSWSSLICQLLILDGRQTPPFDIRRTRRWISYGGWEITPIKDGGGYHRKYSEYWKLIKPYVVILKLFSIYSCRNWRKKNNFIIEESVVVYTQNYYRRRL